MFFFKGEIFELKQALYSQKKAEKRDALKKIIANMTIGKDVRWAGALLLTFDLFCLFTVIDFCAILKLSSSNPVMYYTHFLHLLLF